MIQILLFKNDLVLIAECSQKNVDQFSGQPDYMLTDPVRILCKDEEPDITKRLIKWPDRVMTPSTTMSIYSDDILTVVAPHEHLITAYKELVKS
jgi:hypothetical protein